MKHARHQLHGLTVGTMEILLVEGPQLLQIFKFVNLILRLTVDVHLDFRKRPQFFQGGNPLQGGAVDQIHQGILPIHLFGSRRLIVFLKDREKGV